MKGLETICADMQEEEFEEEPLDPRIQVGLG